MLFKQNICYLNHNNIATIQSKYYPNNLNCTGYHQNISMVEDDCSYSLGNIVDCIDNTDPIEYNAFKIILVYC